MTSSEKRNLAERLRHYAIESLKLAAELDVEARMEAATEGPTPLPFYQPRFEVENGVEVVTKRLACCGAGPDQRDSRTGERLHLPGCPKIAAGGLAACRDALNGDYTEDDDTRARFEQLVDEGGLEGRVR